MKNIVVLMGLGILLAGCHSDAESTDPAAEDRISEQEETIDSFKNEMERLKQKVTDYEKTAEKAVGIMNEKQLRQLAEAHWHYQLEINEQPIKEFDDKSIAARDTLEVRLIETQQEYSPLPNDVHNQGKLDDFHENLEVTPDSYEKSAPAGGTINSVIYRFKEEDFPSQPVEIHIDDPLQERLDLSTGSITITGP